MPEIGPGEVLLKVGAAGMCRTDYQLIDGYFRSALALEFPATPGHEIAGWIDRIRECRAEASGHRRGGPRGGGRWVGR